MGASTTSEYLQLPIESITSRQNAEGLHLVGFEESADCGAGARPTKHQRHHHNQDGKANNPDTRREVSAMIMRAIELLLIFLLVDLLLEVMLVFLGSRVAADRGPRTYCDGFRRDWISREIYRQPARYEPWSNSAQCTRADGRIARQGCTVIVPFREEMAKRHLKVAGDLGRVIFMVGQHG